MAAYLLIASDLRPLDGQPLTATEIFDLMMTHQCWEFTASAPHFRKMQPGDTLVFYLGGQRRRYLAGMAIVAGKPEPITDASPVTFNRNEIPFFNWRLPVSAIQRFVPGTLGLEVVEQLCFARNSSVERKYLGLLLRGGVRGADSRRHRPHHGDSVQAASEIPLTNRIPPAQLSGSPPHNPRIVLSNALSCGQALAERARSWLHKILLASRGLMYLWRLLPVRKTSWSR